MFTRERGAPFTTAGFARMVERAGEAAELGFKAHPHMLRHACGFALANEGHDTRALQAYLGHQNIQHTVATPSCRRHGSKISGKTDESAGFANLGFGNQRGAEFLAASSIIRGTHVPGGEAVHSINSRHWQGYSITSSARASRVGRDGETKRVGSRQG